MRAAVTLPVVGPPSYPGQTNRTECFVAEEEALANRAGKSDLPLQQNEGRRADQVAETILGCLVTGGWLSQLDGGIPEILSRLDRIRVYSGLF